jgi:hypothetical protein
MPNSLPCSHYVGFAVSDLGFAALWICDVGFRQIQFQVKRPWISATLDFSHLGFRAMAAPGDAAALPSSTKIPATGYIDKMEFINGLITGEAPVAVIVAPNSGSVCRLVKLEATGRPHYGKIRHQHQHQHQHQQPLMASPQQLRRRRAMQDNPPCHLWTSVLLFQHRLPARKAVCLHLRPTGYRVGCGSAQDHG